MSGFIIGQSESHFNIKHPLLQPYLFAQLRVAIINFNGQMAEDINVNATENLCTSLALISVAPLQELKSCFSCFLLNIPASCAWVLWLLFNSRWRETASQGCKLIWFLATLQNAAN